MIDYDEAFYLEEGEVASDSAEIVVPWMMANYPIASVVDVGGGTGEWAAWFADHGTSALCVDLGVPVSLRAAEAVDYVDMDLINGYPCSGYDLAICLEVAEHLPPSTGPLLVAGLAQAPTVLFSAATPGQPGVGHINCRDHSYWHALFESHGKTPRFIGDLFNEPVASFYRRNMYVYA